MAQRSTASRRARLACTRCRPSTTHRIRYVEGVHVMRDASHMRRVSQQSLTGGTTLLLTIYRYYGTEHEQKSMVALRLSTNKGQLTIVSGVTIAFLPSVIELMLVLLCRYCG